MIKVVFIFYISDAFKTKLILSYNYKNKRIFSARIMSKSKNIKKDHLLQLMLNSTDQGIYSVDTKVKCTFINKAALKMLGYKEREVIGKDMHKLIHSKYKDNKIYSKKHCPIIKALLNGKGIRLDNEVLWKKNKTHFYTEYSSFPIKKNKKILGAVITFNDISERKYIEKELKEMKNKYISLFKSKAIGEFIAKPNGKINEANDYFLNLIGKSKKDLVRGLSWKKITPSEYSKIDKQKLSRLLKFKEIIPYEKEFVTSEGKRIPVIVGGTIVRGSKSIMAFIIDISSQKKFENLLKESETRFRTALINSPVTVFNQDKNLVYTWADYFSKFFGSKNPVNKTDKDIFDNKKDAENLINLKRQVLSSKNGIRQEVKVRSKENTNYFDLTIEPTFDQSGEVSGLIGSVIEITKEKKLRQSLLRSEERLAMAIDVSKAGYYEHSIPLKNGFVSNRWAQIFGYSLDEIPPISQIRNWWFEKIHYEDKLTMKNIYSKLIKGEVTNFTQEYRIKHKNGNYRWIKSFARASQRKRSGKAKFIVGLEFDITAQKNAEISLKESEKRLQAIIDTSPALIALKDIQGRYIVVNDQFSRFFGKQKNNFIGKDDSLIFSKKIASITTKNDKKVIKEKQTLNYEEIYKEDNRERAFISSKFPLIDSLGNLYAIGYIATDITERIELENRKDEFISMASHELKTPITSIKVFTQILQRQSKNIQIDNSKLYLKRMDAQINRLSNLINELLDVSRIQSNQLMLNIGKINLNKLIKESVENIQATTDRHVIIVRGSIKNKITADKDRIEQVLVNLLTNAIKYSPKGKRIFLNIDDKKDELIISIKDYGMGIPKKYQDRIFERFFRIDDKRHSASPGLGMGLFISKGIIEKHKGKIWVESKVNKGSTFFFTLPKKT